MNTPNLTTKRVNCFGEELHGVLDGLKREGWLVTMLQVKNVAEYTVGAVQDWEKAQQDELFKRPVPFEPG
jgi:hypothetical protein